MHWKAKNSLNLIKTNIPQKQLSFISQLVIEGKEYEILKLIQLENKKLCVFHPEDHFMEIYNPFTLKQEAKINVPEDSFYIYQLKNGNFLLTSRNKITIYNLVNTDMIKIKEVNSEFYTNFVNIDNNKFALISFSSRVNLDIYDYDLKLINSTTLVNVTSAEICLSTNKKFILIYSYKLLIKYDIENNSIVFTNKELKIRNLLIIDDNRIMINEDDKSYIYDYNLLQVVTTFKFKGIMKEMVLLKDNLILIQEYDSNKYFLINADNYSFNIIKTDHHVRFVSSFIKLDDNYLIEFDNLSQ